MLECEHYASFPAHGQAEGGRVCVRGGGIVVAGGGGGGGSPVTLAFLILY